VIFKARLNEKEIIASVHCILPEKKSREFEKKAKEILFDFIKNYLRI
jgi:hypothetical protein